MSLRVFGEPRRESAESVALQIVVAARLAVGCAPLAVALAFRPWTLRVLLGAALASCAGAWLIAPLMRLVGGDAKRAPFPAAAWASLAVIGPVAVMLLGRRFETLWVIGFVGGFTAFSISYLAMALHGLQSPPTHISLPRALRRCGLWLLAWSALVTLVAWALSDLVVRQEWAAGPGPEPSILAALAPGALMILLGWLASSSRHRFLAAVRASQRPGWRVVAIATVPDPTRAGLLRWQHDDVTGVLVREPASSSVGYRSAGPTLEPIALV